MLPNIGNWYVHVLHVLSGEYVMVAEHKNTVTTLPLVTVCILDR